MKLKTNSLARGEATNNIASIIVTMKNKMIRDKSRWGDCLSDKSNLLKQNRNKKVVGNIMKQTC